MLAMSYKERCYGLQETQASDWNETVESGQQVGIS